METWLKIIYVLAFAAFVIFLFPRTKEIIKNSPKAEKGDWMSVIIPLSIVVLFIIFVIQSVR